jgi:hypothetical protein
MLEDLLKSENDKRLYRYLTLPNGLHALLISDPETSVLENDTAKGDADDEESDSGSESGDEVGIKAQACFHFTTMTKIRTGVHANVTWLY